MSLVVGDCRATLARWAAEGVRVQCVVTSPPYWGLRDYGTATWEGGVAACEHKGQPLASSASTLAGYTSESVKLRTYAMPYRDICGKCGAKRIDQQLGLEATPEEYVANLVEVFRLVRDVLADDGTLWLNLGDSYATGAGSVGARPGGGAQGDNWKGAMTSPNRMPIPGLKPKDLVGIPWRVAFALQSDGWYLRSDIVWAKPNPMPESVTDRPTKAHEYLFLLTKRERYFYDAEAIKEPSTGQNGAAANFARATKDHVIPGQGYAQHRLDRNGTMDNGARNKRSVWTIASSPYPEAHFATFPRDLVTPCILAGSRPGDTVLDPFMGSGTVAMVAQDLGRQWRGCELNPDYAVLAARRTRQQGLAL